ncbi:hypothetical protein GN956_G104 [Arapaima gigas]
MSWVLGLDLNRAPFVLLPVHTSQLRCSGEVLKAAGMLLKTLVISIIFTSCLAADNKWKRSHEMKKHKEKEKGKVSVGQEVSNGSNVEARNEHAGRGMRQPRVTNDVACTSMGGICQRKTYVCQGRYLEDKCRGPREHQCCMPDSGAWDILCSGHHQNRVRACDRFGCGAFNPNRGSGTHRAVDVVCDDYSVVNAPFSGTLAGPVRRRAKHGIQYDGVKLFGSEYCVKIFNIRPYRYGGPISKGEPLGYLLPLQDRFSGITSHLELQMCDHSNPSPYI